LTRPGQGALFAGRLGLLWWSALVAIGCSQRLEVFSYHAIDEPDASSEEDAGRAGCDACREGSLCSAGSCVPLSTIASVSTGTEHTCVALGGVLSCWGSNSAAQLGVGDSAQHRVPTRVGSNEDWLDVAAGARHTCGLRAPGALYCWGDNSQGQLGTGMAGTRPRSSPVRVGMINDFTKVSCGGDSCCALRSGGPLYCWGANTDGNAGINRSASGAVVAPTQVSAGSGFATVSVGAAHSCAVRDDGALLCWGRNADGELGLGSSRVAQRQPTRVGSASDWHSVSCGPRHTCGIRGGGALLCWGGNDYAQVGIGREGPDGVVLVIDEPIAIDPSGGWGNVAAGGFHTCARKERSSELFCWGRANSGQLGIGAASDVVEAPTRVSTSATLRRFALGMLYGCAFDAERQLYCWGDNAQGQLGLADTSRRDEPVMVAL
jgi:alpha-tubulin suppressor-like RCC1 family protein